jgi:hypothetical protein
VIFYSGLFFATKRHRSHFFSSRRTHGHVTKHFPLCDDAPPVENSCSVKTVATTQKTFGIKHTKQRDETGCHPASARHQTDDKHHLFLMG